MNAIVIFDWHLRETPRLLCRRKNRKLPKSLQYMRLETLQLNVITQHMCTRKSCTLIANQINYEDTLPDRVQLRYQIARCIWRFQILGDHLRAGRTFFMLRWPFSGNQESKIARQYSAAALLSSSSSLSDNCDEFAPLGNGTSKQENSLTTPPAHFSNLFMLQYHRDKSRHLNFLFKRARFV